MNTLNRALTASVLLALGGFAGCKATCCAPMTKGTSGSRVGDDGRERVYATPPSSGVEAALGTISTPVAGHPRLWVRSEDLPRLRSWAVADNVVYAQGLSVVAAQAVADMDAGKVPAAGDCIVEGRFCESYAMLFAFLSLTDPDEGKRADYARRSRTVLMHMMDRVKAAAPGDTFAAARFSLSDRSRWAGEAFGLTVDWIYPHLSAKDKATIRDVFLRWAEEQLHAQVTTANHPEPVGMIDDPQLVKDRTARRYAANNYFTAHMRNLALMAMSLDEADDPPSPAAGRTIPTLRGYLKNATGAWLYMADHVLANDARGGVAPEGFEYAPRTLAFVMQTYWALESAGLADTSRFGSQVLRANNPFWKELTPAFLHMLSPGRVEPSPRAGTAHEPIWTGDGERSTLVDFVDVFAPLGLSARLHGDAALLETARWIQLHTPMGGEAALARRASAHRGALGYRQSILYYMLFDPKAPKPRDPRASLALTHYGEGLGQIFARTGWGDDARWLTYQLAWAHIDHQHGDGNSFSFYRGGEWLTKERVGYGWHFENSDQHNTLCVENDRPNHPDDERRGSYWKRGSQWVLSHTHDPRMVAHSFHDDYVFAAGDSTGMYNSEYESVSDVRHVSRSMVWLKPDTIVTYDRAETGADGRFKRYWLHTPTVATVAGSLATVTTPKGQKLFVRTLLPEGAVVKAQAYGYPLKWPSKPADGERMGADLLVEPAKMDRSVRFLHVLQGADAGSAPVGASLVRCSRGACEGAVFGSTAVLFPIALSVMDEVEVGLPGGVQRVMVTGLAPNEGFAAVKQAGGGGVKVRVTKGGGQRTDAGGVLWF